MKTLLLVDDEREIRQSLKRLLRSENYDIIEAENGQDALELLQNNDVHVIISDQRMPEMTGSEFFTVVQEKYPDTVRMILSGYTDFDALTASINDGSIYKFLCKPWDNIELKQHVLNSFLSYDKNIKKKKLIDFFNISQEIMVITDRLGNVQTLNPAFQILTGYNDSDLIGLSFFDDYLQLDEDEYQSLTGVLLKKGFWQDELWIKRKGGSYFPCWLSITAIKGLGDKVLSYTILLLDISEQKNTDNVTGLATLDSLMTKLRCVVNNTTLHTEAYAILSISISRFDSITKNIGYRAGNDILISVSKRLEKYLPDGSIIATYNGSQFAIWVKNIPTDTIIQSNIEALIQAFKLPFRCGGEDITINLKIGISLSPTDSKIPENLLKYAETAMTATSSSNSAYKFYARAMSDEMNENWALERELNKGIAQDQLEVYYQAQVHLASNKITGMEALIRWKHPQMGFVSPARFIPIAEKSKSILDIGKWVLYNACLQAKQWHTMGYDHLTIAVNLSVVQLREPGFTEMVESTIVSLGFPGSKLRLEITENMLIENSAEIEQTIIRLCRLGIHFAIDDFGTGYSSFDYIKRFPFSTLKIDQSFVRDLPDETKNKAIVKSILEMARNLNLNVVAEGIENIDQYNFIKDHGCNEGQGYFISRPLPAEKFTKLLACYNDKKCNHG